MSPRRLPGRPGPQPPEERPTRDRVLQMVRDADEPVSAHALAAALGLHPNTVRFHLDALERQGAIERASSAPDPLSAPPGPRGVGRPPLRYRRARRMSAAAGRTDYRLLAAALVGQLSARAENPAATALDIGRASGALLLAEAEPPAEPGEDQHGPGVERVVTALDALGFQPEPATPGRAEIRLRHCPFLELAATHADVTCSLHLGLLQGALDAMDSPITATGIEPFAQPDLCLVRLGRRSER